MDELKQEIKISKLINQVAMLLRNNVTRNFNKKDITPTQGIIIRTLAMNNEMTMSELSSKIGLSNSTICGIIDRMQNKGIVERIRSKNDRRVVNVRLTQAFKEKNKDLHKKIKSSIQNILSQSSKEEQEKIIEGLSTLKNLLEKNLSEKNNEKQ